jgi:toxin-antitoxin system PIN domain toxin
VRIPDANILLYTADASAAHHASARAWLEEALSGTEPIGFALVVLLAFVRIATSPRIFESPLKPSTAFDQVDEWLAQGPATLVGPGPLHLRIWRNLMDVSGATGNLTNDAHLAALAIEHGATLASFDGDMHRFADLKLEYLRS